MTDLVVVIEPLYADTVLPSRATWQSAGWDVAAYLHGRYVAVRDGQGYEQEVTCEPSLCIPAGARALVPLGFRAKLPPFMEAQIRPRSGLAWKHGLGIANSPGTIDADYPLEWMVVLENRSATAMYVTHGMRVAQVVMATVAEVRLVEGTVAGTTNRTGGFGSTGA